MARSLRVRNQTTSTAPSSPESAPAIDRPRRAAQQKTYREDEDDLDDEEESITLQRPPPQYTGSIKLKLKMPPSKLRESTTTRARDPSESAEPIREARSSRGRRQIVVESDSDEEDDAEDDEDLSEEEEDEDADGDSDVEMDDAPTPPVIKKTTIAGKPTITITSAPKSGPVKSVEAQEISMATGENYDDDDLSDLTNDDLDESIMEEDAIEGEEDAEGDSFDEDDLSRSGTPDLSKLTKRQRALVDTSADDHFMALNMGPQSRLALTDEQRNLRRVEMARRRKNLSEKRNEEEKQDTINRLLKKQAPKRRGKISAAEIAAGGEIPDMAIYDVENEIVRPDAVFTRWVSGPKGIKLGVPVEWKDTTIGKPFGGTGWKLIEEVEA